MRWEGKGHVYHANDLFAVSEGPFCRQGMPPTAGPGVAGASHFQPEVLQEARGLIGGHVRGKPANGRRAVVLVNNNPGAEAQARRLTAAGFDTVSRVLVGDHLTPGDLLAFHEADAIVGASGPHLSGVVFSHPGASLVEVGGPETPSTFARLAVGLRLQYRLVFRDSRPGVAGSLDEVIAGLA